jgi:hypothetical protein
MADLRIGDYFRFARARKPQLFMNNALLIRIAVVLFSQVRRTLANAYSSGKRIWFALPGRFLPFQEIKESSDLL